MVLRPASMFGCGCSLQFGVVVILTFHLAANLAYLGVTFSHIVLHYSTFSSELSDWSPWAQFTMIGFIMAGVPVILLALYGVARRMDVALRLYLGYLFISFIIDSVALIYFFLWKDNDGCKGSGAAFSHMSEEVGAAFMCGFLRILSYIGVAVAICMEVYCLFIVWSLCEDIHEGTNGLALWELLPAKAAAFEKKHALHKGERLAPYADIVGLAHTKLPGAYPSPYGAMSDFGFTQNTPMFASTGSEFARW